MRNKETSKWQAFLEQLQYKYRVVLIDEATLEEHRSILLSRLNVYGFLCAFFLATVFLVVLLIVGTSAKELIPGYGDSYTRRQAVYLTQVTDSLGQKVLTQAAFIKNMQRLLSGNVDTLYEDVAIPENVASSDSIDLAKIDQAELNLRKEVEQKVKYDGHEGHDHDHDYGDLESIGDMDLERPIKGYISDVFEPDKGHFGLDVVAKEKTKVKAISNGVIILASFIKDTGHTIAIQHENNLVSFYKHNSVLLKKVGSFVKAGEEVAVIGNSGEESTGIHLHFELWHQQTPIDPTKYIQFK